MNELVKSGNSEDVDLCESTFEPGELSVEDQALIYDPWARERPGSRVEIWGHRENSSLFAWGFWGGVLAVGAVVALVLAYSSPFRVPASTVVPLLATIIAGAVAYRLGPTSNLQERLLLEIDARHQVISWPTASSTTVVALAFEDVKAVAFEKIRFAVPGSRANTHIDAAAVYLVDHEDRKLPVIEASTTQAEAHKVARLLAHLLKQELDYVGTGTGEWA